MILEVCTDIHGNGVDNEKLQKLHEFIASVGELWEVLPGIQYAEITITDLTELASFMKKCEDIMGLPLAFEMGLAPKNHENDEDMVEVTIMNARKPIGI